MITEEAQSSFQSVETPVRAVRGQKQRSFNVGQGDVALKHTAHGSRQVPQKAKELVN
jgi:hypothetical protein